jgi:hypothetical protein
MQTEIIFASKMLDLTALGMSSVLQLKKKRAFLILFF